MLSIKFKIVIEPAPFYEKGGLVKANQLFGDELTNVMEELNEVLVG